MKPSERIRELFNEKAKKDNRDYKFLHASNVEKAIIDFLDEQYEKEGSIVGEKCFYNNPNKSPIYCETHQCFRDEHPSPKAQEKECKFCEMTDGLPGGYCLEHGSSADKHVFEEETTTPKNPACGVTDQMLGEPVSERNDDDAKKCPYRIPDCPIDYPDVSERNSLID